MLDPGWKQSLFGSKVESFNNIDRENSKRIAMNLKKQCTFFLSLFVFCMTLSLRAEVDYFPPETYLEEYINQMPWHYYGQYEVSGLGKFWVDDAYDVVKDEVKAGRIWEPYLINTIAQYVKPGDKVVDIGAHMGTITLAMSNLVGDTGQVYSFEAERQFFRELVENIKLNQKRNIKPHLAWIGNQQEIIKVNWFYGPDYSPVHGIDEKAYPLHVCKLDDFRLKNIALMKIDVECTEDLVLEGAYNTIMDSRPILIIEIMGGYGDKITPEIQERIDYTIGKLNSMNYAVSKIWVDDYLAVPVEKL